MKLKKSSLQFIDYTVNRLSFSAIPGFKADENETFELNPQFSRKIQKVKNNHYAVTLDLQLGGDAKRLPFVIDVSITGAFITKDIEKPIEYLKCNATAILFPYLRSILTMLSSLASVPPIILPPVNFSAMLNDHEKCIEKAES